MSPRSLWRISVLIALVYPSMTQGGVGEPVEIQYWFSPDRTELYIAAVVSSDPAASRLYYFNNDSARLCYTFTVSGRWTLDPATGSMSSSDGKGSLGQGTHSAEDLDVASGVNLVEAELRWNHSLFSEALETWCRRERQVCPEPGYSSEPCQSVSRPSCIKWKAAAAMERQGRETRFKQQGVIVEAAPGWVLSIEATDDVALEAVESLRTAPGPECFWPFIEEHFPQLKRR